MYDDDDGSFSISSHHHGNPCNPTCAADIIRLNIILKKRQSRNDEGKNEKEWGMTMGLYKRFAMMQFCRVIDARVHWSR